MSEERETVDLAFIGRALQRLTTEVASLRDDVNVLTAIVQRLDNSHTRLLAEIRAPHSQVPPLGEPSAQAQGGITESLAFCRTPRPS